MSTEPQSIYAFEGELNDIVNEYLEFGGFEKTIDAYKDECLQKGRTPPRSSTKLQSDMKKIEIQHELMSLFRSGNRKEFFSLWNDTIPESTQSKDLVCQKLVFYLNIFFAVYPLKHNTDNNRTEATDSMADLRAYMEAIRHTGLTQTTEFLPYYALPFVTDLPAHPSDVYKELFTEKWDNELTVRLERFLKVTLKSFSQPELMTLYRNARSQQETSARQKSIEDKFFESEKRNLAYKRKLTILEGDYHNVLNISAELVDALEDCVNGKFVDPEYLATITQRLISNHATADSVNPIAMRSVDVSRPGTAGSVIRQSVPSHKPNVKLLPELDYFKVKDGIAFGEERRRLLLLQALRWRLTRSQPGQQRSAVIYSFAQKDLLGCASHSTYSDKIMGFLKTDNDKLTRQYTARLFNTLASLSPGRTYLARNKDLLPTLIQVLKSENLDDPITYENCLGALQKLSLKRQLQTVMIRSDLIEWLIQELSDSDNLSDYCLDYSVALLMNLSLRSAGKLRCAQDPNRVLSVLTDLMGHELRSIQPYVNGALYSLLSVPSIREQAKDMSLEDVLKMHMNDSSGSEMNRQLEFIIRQLNTTEDTKIDAANSDDEEEEDEDEDQDAIETDLDKNEQIVADEGEIVGEDLLRSDYLAILATYSLGSRQGGARPTREKYVVPLFESKEDLLTRPITPGIFHLSERSGVDVEPGVSPQLPGDNSSRPPTRSGSADRTSPVMTSRENSETLALEDSHRISESLGKEVHVGKAVDRDVAKPSSKSLKKNEDVHEYSAAFSSRPKIPRTPEVNSRFKNTHTPTPRVSYASPTWSNRPMSNGEKSPKLSSRKQ